MAKKDFVEALALVDIYLSNDIRIPCNSVVFADKDFAQQYAEVLDTAPEAVAYAKSDGAAVIDVAAVITSMTSTEPEGGTQ